MAKRILSVICIMGMILLMLAGCGGDPGRQTSAGNETTTPVEDGVGKAVKLQNDEADEYFDFLVDADGMINAMVYPCKDGEHAENPVIVWSSADQGANWQEVVHMPEALGDTAELLSGTLAEGKGGIEVYAVFFVGGDDSQDVQKESIYHITEKKCEELDTTEVFEELDSIIEIYMVNDHVCYLASSEKAILYDVEQQKVVKTLPNNPLAVLPVSMKDQFMLYGQEVVCCLNKETLEEQEAEEGLQKFVKEMYANNREEVAPPMYWYDDALACATEKEIYEYRDGKTVPVLSIPNEVSNGKIFNGMLPMCKGKNNTYYVFVLPLQIPELFRIEEDKNVKNDIFTIYSLTNNQDVSQIAILFQQAHPELKVEYQIGMEGDAALTRTDAIKQLNTELLAGEGPDIIFMDGLSVEKYANLGLLLPLEVKPESGKYFDQMMQTYQMGDALYAVPAGFWLYGAQGNENEDLSTPKAMGQWVLSNAAQEGITGYTYSPNYNVFNQYVQFLYELYADQLVQDQKVDEAALKEYMSLCKQLSESVGTSAIDEEITVCSIMNGSVEIHFNEAVTKAAGALLEGGDAAALVTQQAANEADYQLYPMYCLRDIVAVNANTTHLELAQEFAAFVLDDSVQLANVNFTFPVAIEHFRAALKGEGKDPEPEGIMISVSVGDDQEEFDIYCVPDDVIAEIEQEVKGIDQAFDDDVIIRDIVEESLESYLSETESLEDAVSTASNKINLYLSE